MTARLICRPTFAARPWPVRQSRTHRLDTRCRYSRGHLVARPRYPVGHLSGLHSEDETRAPKRPFQAQLPHATPDRLAGLLRRRPQAAPACSRCQRRAEGQALFAWLGTCFGSCPAPQGLRLSGQRSARPRERAVWPHDSRTRRHWSPRRSCRVRELSQPGPGNQVPVLSLQHRGSSWSALARATALREMCQQCTRGASFSESNRCAISGAW